MDPINLAYCESCTNKGFDQKKGILCSLTNEKPNFDNSCASFKVDDENLQYATRSIVENSALVKSNGRVINYFIDYIFVLTLFYFLAPLILISVDVSIYLFLGIVTMVNAIYYFVAEYNFQRTIGKIVTKSKVVDLKTFQKPSIKQVLIRSLFRLPILNTVDAICFLGGYKLHDKASGTQVVKSDETLIGKSQILIRLKGS